MARGEINEKFHGAVAPSAFSSQNVTKLGSRPLLEVGAWKNGMRLWREAPLQPFSEGQMSKNGHTYVDIDT